MDDNSSSSIFGWKLANGSTLVVNQNASEVQHCEPQTAKRIFLDPTRTQLASGYAYIIGGVSVDRNAVGVPVGWEYDIMTTFGSGIWQQQLTHPQW